jgi:hypothetical protein
MSCIITFKQSYSIQSMVRVVDVVVFAYYVVVYFEGFLLFVELLIALITIVKCVL